jgi:signal transduction histidine kinase/ligand-binding sensor domain-containing protein
MRLRMLRLSTFLVLLATFHPGPLSALDPHKTLTQYSVSVWTQQNGLPQDAVRAIAQTTDGYLWLGTDEGLARFDGYEFVSLQRERGAPASNSISALAAGRDGSLWIGSRHGLTRYKEGIFQTYTRKEGLIDNLVSDLFVDHSGVLWIVAGGNLSRFTGGHFTNFVSGQDLPLRSVRAVTESPDHRLYICGNSSVVTLVDGRFISVIGPSVLSSDFPSHIQADKAGNLWITGARGVLERLSDGTLKRYRRREGLTDAFGMNTIAEDSAGAVWVGTDWGLARLEGSGKRFRNLPETRDGMAVRCIFEDREGNLWVGSDNGLTRYRDDLFTTLGKSEGLPDNGPAAIFEDHAGTLWAGYDDGLVRMTGHRPPVVRVSNARLFVRHLHETNAGELLVPSRQGLIRIKEGRQSTFVAPDPQGRKTVFDALEGRDGSLWLALPNGLGQISDSQIGKSHFRTVIPAGPLYQDDSFYVLAATDDGAIWAGTLSDGLWRYRNGEKRLFTPAEGLGSSQIRALYADKDGTLWIGTVNGGLNSFREGKFIQYRARDGLLSDNIYGITDDGESLWLSTPRGICRVPRNQLANFAQHRSGHLRPVNYTVDDGLRSVQTTAGQRLANGSLGFATSRGIAVYDPRVNIPAPLAPLVHILDLSIDRRSFGSVHPKLPLGPGRIQIRYAGIHLRAPDQVRYSYKLEGLDSDWAGADASRIVNYDSLGHGHYLFRVRAELPGGPSSESSLGFDIEPHYYETSWFRAFGLLLLSAMILAAYKLRERQIRSRFALVLAERARLAREVHDTLAQGYAGIASQLDVVEMKLPADAGEARTELDYAERMVRHSLTEARRSLMDLRAAALDEQDLAMALESGAVRWAARSRAAVNVRVSGDASKLPEDVAHHVFRIAQEAVANAVNHASPNHIGVELGITPEQLFLQVEDDGCGFELEPFDLEPGDTARAQRGNFGLIGMRERAERIKGKLLFESQPGKGTRVAVTVPLR